MGIEDEPKIQQACRKSTWFIGFSVARYWNDACRQSRINEKKNEKRLNVLKQTIESNTSNQE